MDSANLSIDLIPKRFTLTGFSRAARKTGLYIPECRFMLDCGNPSQYIPDKIFITHGHIDHTSEVAKVLIDTGAVHPTIFCPAEIKNAIYNVINSFFVLTKNTEKPRVHNKYSLVGVTSGKKDDVSRVNVLYDKKNKKRVTMVAEIIRCYHHVPCVGYGFIEIRQKLRPEYQKLSQEEIGRAKSEGNDVTHDVEYPLFCFMGDTNERALLSVVDGVVIYNPTLEKFKTIIIECTFLDPNHLEHAVKDSHMHWSKLAPYVQSHPDTRFILIHFSARYSDEYIKKFFETVGFANVVPFIRTGGTGLPIVTKSERFERSDESSDDDDDDDELDLTDGDLTLSPNSDEQAACTK